MSKAGRRARTDVANRAIENTGPASLPPRTCIRLVIVQGRSDGLPSLLLPLPPVPFLPSSGEGEPPWDANVYVEAEKRPLETWLVVVAAAECRRKFISPRGSLDGSTISPPPRVGRAGIQSCSERSVLRAARPRHGPEFRPMSDVRLRRRRRPRSRHRRVGSDNVRDDGRRRISSAAVAAEATVRRFPSRAGRCGYRPWTRRLAGRRSGGGKRGRVRYDD